MKIMMLSNNLELGCSGTRASEGADVPGDQGERPHPQLLRFGPDLCRPAQLGSSKLSRRTYVGKSREEHGDERSSDSERNQQAQSCPRPNLKLHPPHQPFLALSFGFPLLIV